jgi:FKBP-type peptidyl-prolyl cis-trans isomerase SlyD
MQVAHNHVVQFHYTVKDESGEVLESSEGHQPLAFLHGHGNLLPALENAMLGRKASDEFNVILPPEDAYGLVKENMLQRVPLKQLKGAKNWKPGMVAMLQLNHGTQLVTIRSAGKFMAEVDLNHPQAGKTLTFEVKIMSVREASQEEITHGHAHGPGGHHH